jgi:hypothetical protein
MHWLKSRVDEPKCETSGNDAIPTEPAPDSPNQQVTSRQASSFQNGTPLEDVENRLQREASLAIFDRRQQETMACSLYGTVCGRWGEDKFESCCRHVCRKERTKRSTVRSLLPVRTLATVPYTFSDALAMLLL